MERRPLEKPTWRVLPWRTMKGAIVGYCVVCGDGFDHNVPPVRVVNDTFVATKGGAGRMTLEKAFAAAIERCAARNAAP
jgi:hypothetical protein